MDLEKSYVAHLSDNDGHAALNTDHGDYDQGYGVSEKNRRNR
jgi:hypothetical protein